MTYPNTPTTPDPSTQFNGGVPALWRWMWAPPALVVLGLSPVWWDASVIWWAAAAIGLLSTVVVWRLHAQAQSAASAAQHMQGAPDCGQAELADLLTNVLPAWQHHVVAVKAQTEEAVLQLTTSFSVVL
nr:hypothetical protein [uncultured Rhodoferax sp.]